MFSLLCLPGKRQTELFNFPVLTVTSLAFPTDHCHDEDALNVKGESVSYIFRYLSILLRLKAFIFSIIARRAYVKDRSVYVVYTMHRAYPVWQQRRVMVAVDSGPKVSSNTLRIFVPAQCACV